MSVFSNTHPGAAATMDRMKITPVLIVESVEKSLAFWADRMGFEKTVEVPAEDGLAFVILVREGAELMLQSVASVRRDEPRFVREHGNSGALFIEVEDFEDVRKRLEGYPVAMPERVTFYQMREVGVFEPGGNTVIFAVKV
jgi:catechol 2,3-dioxygenase-like lactoylglutathione lyase family enzyme